MDRFAYSDHGDLLDQVATSALERDEVRRILGAELRGKLTEADLDARIAERDAAPSRLPCGVRRHAALPLERLAAIGALLVSVAIVAVAGAWLIMLLQRGLQ